MEVGKVSAPPTGLELQLGANRNVEDLKVIDVPKGYKSTSRL